MLYREKACLNIFPRERESESTIKLCRAYLVTVVLSTSFTTSKTWAHSSVPKYLAVVGFEATAVARPSHMHTSCMQSCLSYWLLYPGAGARISAAGSG